MAEPEIPTHNGLSRGTSGMLVSSSLMLGTSSLAGLPPRPSLLLIQSIMSSVGLGMCGTNEKAEATQVRQARVRAKRRNRFILEQRMELSEAGRVKFPVPVYSVPFCLLRKWLAYQLQIDFYSCATLVKGGLSTSSETLSRGSMPSLAR